MTNPYARDTTYSSAWLLVMRQKYADARARLQKQLESINSEIRAINAAIWLRRGADKPPVKM